MAPQPRSMMDIPTDIILHMVEHMNTDTRERFVSTNEGIFNLVKTYERAISKSRAATFMLAPQGNILSSSSYVRSVLQKNTFAMVSELELRDHRMDRLIKECPKIFCVASPPWLPCLTPRQQYRLVPILKRALYQCDRIADIAANMMPQQFTAREYRAILDGVYESPSALTQGTFNPLTRPGARYRQIMYIKSLSLEDVAGIFILTHMLGYGLTCLCSDTSYERKTVVEECVLRHGTWFVWSRLLGDPGMQELAGYIISAGRAELRLWETGALQDGPPGLKMTLMRRFNSLVGGGDPDQVATKMERTLKKLVIDDGE
ncbi:hypothetical protein F4803DRAFT_393938 [Xylaria telfairii]|nr:hypothetical protein F4803DRAFT_393938 [Xylaria telfairii]